MTLWSNRTTLAARGWTTEIGITAAGAGIDEIVLGIRARRSDWQGWSCELCFNLHDLQPRDGALPAHLEALGAELRELCERAERDFPDEIPMQMARRYHGGPIGLMRNEMECEHALGRKRDLWPSERLDGADLLADRGRHATDLLAASRLAEIEDRLGPDRRPLSPRSCLDRSWSYGLTARMPQSPGEGRADRSLELRFSLLDESLVGNLLQDASARLVQSCDASTRARIVHGQSGSGLLPSGNPALQAGPEMGMGI